MRGSSPEPVSGQTLFELQVSPPQAPRIQFLPWEVGERSNLPSKRREYGGIDEVRRKVLDSRRVVHRALGVKDRLWPCTPLSIAAVLPFCIHCGRPMKTDSGHSPSAR